jgi:hypothetical protein
MKEKGFYNKLIKKISNYHNEITQLEETKNDLKKLEISNLESLFSSILKKDINYRVNKHSLVIEDVIDSKNVILFKVEFIKNENKEIEDLKIILFETNFKSTNFEKITNIGNITQDLLISKDIIISQINTILKETQKDLFKNFITPLSLVIPDFSKLKEEFTNSLIIDIINKLQTTPLIFDKRWFNIASSPTEKIQIDDITSFKVNNFSKDSKPMLEVEYISSISKESFVIKYDDTILFKNHLFTTKSIPWFIEWCGYDKVIEEKWS